MYDMTKDLSNISKQMLMTPLHEDRSFNFFMITLMNAENTIFRRLIS